MTKIAFYIPTLSGGGAERATVALADALDRELWEVHIFVDRDGASDYQPKRSEVHSMHSRSVAQSVLRLRSLLREHKPDVLYSLLPHLNAVASLGTVFARGQTKIVTSVHNNLTAEFRQLSGGRAWRALTPLTYKFSDAVCCVSQGVASQQVSAFHATRRKVHYVPNIIDYETITISAKEPINNALFDGNHRVILAPGRLVKQKQWEIAIAAFSHVAKIHVNSRLVFIGEGPERHNLERLAAELGVSESVSFLGRVDNPYSYMSKSSCVVLTSSYEGFGMVLIEAIASGTFAVSTDCEFGPSEVLSGSSRGLLVSENDSRAFADAVLSALDFNLPDGHAVCDARFTKAAVLRRFQDVMAEVLSV